MLSPFPREGPCPRLAKRQRTQELTPMQPLSQADMMEATRLTREGRLEERTVI